MAKYCERANTLRARFHGEDGSTLPLFAVTLMAIVALAFAAIALGLDSKAANNLQNAADSAALAGATAFVAANSPRAEDRLEEARQTALATAQGNAEYVLSNMDIAAISEDAYGQHTEIEVALAFEPANVAAKVLGRNANIALTREAAASTTWGFPLCILALEPTGNGLSTADSTSLSAMNCVIWSNSTGARSMAFSGGDAETKFFCAAGKAPVSGGTQISPRPTEHCDRIPDPLNGLQIPTPGKSVAASLTYAKVQVTANAVALVEMINRAIPRLSLLGSDYDALKTAAQTGTMLPETTADSIANTILGILSGGGKMWLDDHGYYKIGAARGLHILEVAQILGIVDNLPANLIEDDVYFSSPTDTLLPGTYKGLDIYKGHVKMMPGVYHIVDAPLIVRRKATLTGDGVTIILHGRDATFSVTDEARLTLTAPEDGDMAGFALISDPKSIPDGVIPRSRLTGAGKVSMIGTVYLPEQRFSITGDGAADQASPLLQIVANSIDMSKNGGLKIDFDTSETKVPMKILPARQARLLR
ncbi:MAG: pilus assembly protein TadG-related protein [Hyphomonas sp.]|uniref:pilus assembly protein TadG-related protein n=1 Tax=Hyphomonas sp. TaxID=87 RepID=UPI0035273D87